MVVPTFEEWYKWNEGAVSLRANVAVRHLSDPHQLFKTNIPLGAKRKKDPALAAFLKANRLAKIVILVDSHSTQDGTVVTKIKGDHTFSDALGQVSPILPNSRSPLTKSQRSY